MNTRQVYFITSRSFRLLCLFIWLISATSLAQKPIHGTTSRRSPRIHDFVFQGASLGRDMHYRVLLPAGYEDGGRFPVLYLLHGLYGDHKNWDTMTGLENYAKNLGIVVAMPHADDSWYTNSASILADRFEDYIAKDFVSEIDNRFRTIRDRHGRAIAGLSMGGYGSLKFALKYPQLFAFAGSLSGALNAAQNLDELRPEFGNKLLEVYGKAGSPTRSQNDIFILLNAPHPDPHPYFYLACGAEDFFLDTNRAFAQQLSSKKLTYEYHENPGGHTWEYWDRELQPLLNAVVKQFDKDHAPKPMNSR